MSGLTCDLKPTIKRPPIWEKTLNPIAYLKTLFVHPLRKKLFSRAIAYTRDIAIIGDDQYCSPFMGVSSPANIEGCPDIKMKGKLEIFKGFFNIDAS